MSIQEDARDFGQHFKQGGWRLGLLVARNVYVSGTERGRSDLQASRVGKVTANQFAETAGVSARSVQLYYRAWELAADKDECLHATELSPGSEDGNINFDEDDDAMRAKWSAYYKAARVLAGAGLADRQRSAPGPSSRKPRTPQARLSAAVESIKGIDVSAADDLSALGQSLQDTRKLICGLIDQYLEQMECSTDSEPKSWKGMNR
ncbi:hypothetical protein [Mycobacterium palustre]|uniref:hypothetical protein n=1 Tax=Mycobacterium palustre TaxID=153971 RepID=UPI0011529CA0|nr:hypothetical protein [Mycobacterium palustre]MCV7100729.1 hypothetical protein [Mycobacterium palustre]